MSKTLKITTIFASLSAATLLHAGAIGFDGSWKTINFPLKNKMSYGLNGGSLTVSGADAASMVYKPLDASLRGAKTASWNWSVSQSVPATNLGAKGQDDRNLSIYFLFTDAASAANLNPNTKPSSLLNNKNVRVLVYTWGGNHGRGKFVSSPYLGGRGIVVVKRNAGEGNYSESVNLANDYAAAFGRAPEALIAVAVSSDSDDTNSAVKGAISGLSIK